MFFVAEVNSGRLMAMLQNTLNFAKFFKDRCLKKYLDLKTNTFHQEYSICVYSVLDFQEIIVKQIEQTAEEVGSLWRRTSCAVWGFEYSEILEAQNKFRCQRCGDVLFTEKSLKHHQGSRWCRTDKTQDQLTQLRVARQVEGQRWDLARDNTEKAVVRTVEGEQIITSKSFKYLGTEIDGSGKTTVDTERRLEKAKARLGLAILTMILVDNDGICPVSVLVSSKSSSPA